MVGGEILLYGGFGYDKTFGDIYSLSFQSGRFFFFPCLFVFVCSFVSLLLFIEFSLISLFLSVEKDSSIAPYWDVKNV